MKSSNYQQISREIVLRSKQDTIECAPSLNTNPSFIPKELKEVLERGMKLYPNMSPASMQYFKVMSRLSSFNNWSSDIYWYIWKLLLYLEHYQNVYDMKQYSMQNQKISRSKYRTDEFIINVPGLAEDRPSLRSRDEIELLQVNGRNHCISQINYVGSNYVSVSVNVKFNNAFQADQIYNIEFRYPDWGINCLNHVLNELQKYKLSPMLFPVENSSMKMNFNSPIKWISENIINNYEQQQAVRYILNKTAHPAPYILFGPPGTGKTSTLVEAICQIVKQNSNSRILICTPSNAAADEIAIRLKKNCIPEKALYRLYSASRNSNDIHENIKPFSNFIDTQPVYVCKEVFVTKKIVISTLSTCIRLYNYNLRENHFAYLFVDEAGQATELETLISFLLMSKKNDQKFCGQIVIAGDPQQLGPIIQSRLAKPLLGKSMLERLMEWGHYKKNPINNKYNSNYVTKLVQNYRCHEAILHIPNKLFYDNELIAKGGAHTRIAIDWLGLTKKKFPVIFHAVQGNEARENNSPSVYNPDEVTVVVNYIQKLLKSKLNKKLVSQQDIGVITPYKLQKTKILQALKHKRIDQTAVGTVEIFQGQERDIIIISTVRSVLYRHKQEIHIGFLSNPKRFNVALTRAKALLIVIGNPAILQHDKYWATFLQYCVDNQACTGHKFTMQKYVNPKEISKLLGKKHVMSPSWNTKHQESVIEDPASAPSEKSFTDEHRRRRQPYGPLPNHDIYLDSALVDCEIDCNEHYLIMERSSSDDENSFDIEQPYYHNYNELSDDDDSSSDEMRSNNSLNMDFFDSDEEESSCAAQLCARMRNLDIS